MNLEQNEIDFFNQKILEADSYWAAARERDQLGEVLEILSASGLLNK